MAEKSIRDIIHEKSESLRDMDALGPAKAAEELVEISALLASINKEVTERNYGYNLLCRTKLAETKVAAKAKIEAQASEEWKDWQMAIGYQKAALEIIRALKYYLRRISDEQHESKY